MTWILQPGCDCVARNDLRACDECEPGGTEISCLDYFDIAITLPYEDYERYSGTYFFNGSARGNVEFFNVNGSCMENFMIQGDVYVSLKLYRMPYVAGIHFQVIASTPVYAQIYGTTFTKGSFKMIDPRFCEGHCNGSFRGVRADSFFYYTTPYNPYGYTSDFNAWIMRAPGSFSLPANQTWGSDPFNIFPPCNYECESNEEQTDSQPVLISWGLKTRPATQSDVDSGWAREIGEPVPIPFPYHLSRY